MRFLIYANDEFMWSSIAWRLQNFENQDVRIYSKNPEERSKLQGMVKHVNSLEEALSWVKRDGYILSNDETDVSLLRRMKYRVYGGNKFTEKIENSRVFGMEVAKKAGINIPNYHPIKNIQEGIKFVKANPDQYVIKQEGDAPKAFNYVGRYEDGSDVVEQLEWMAKQKNVQSVGFVLQEFVEGLEFATAAFWMGSDWKRDDDGNVLLEINREHKKSMDGDIGMTCGEAGTVARFTVKDTKLFEETLNKLTPILKEKASDVCINIDANCGICEEDGEIKAYLYEWTPRTGYPISALQEYLLDTKVGDFYADMIDGIQGRVKWKDEWGVVTVLGCGRYPNDLPKVPGSFKDQPIEFPFRIENWDKHVSPNYIRYDPYKGLFYLASEYEYVADFCYSDKDISVANKQCVEAMEKTIVRAPHYRTDVGEKFKNKELPQLIKWGYIENNH
jgi:phosphoribosylamine-glycine ligase